MTSRIKDFLQGPWGRTYIVTLVFIVIASGLFWLDFFRGYESETSVLFLVQNGQSANEVAYSMEKVLRSGAFYERMEKDFPGIAAGESLSREQKYAFWKSHLSTEVPLGTGVLTFFVEGQDMAETKELTEAAAKTLFAATNLYYQKGNPVDVRVIEGPLFALRITKPFLFVFVSAFSGLAATTFFFGMLGFFGKPVQRKHASPISRDSVPEKELHALENRIGEAVPWIDPQKFVPVRPSNLEMAYRDNDYNEVHSENVSLGEPLSVAPARAAAPGNLPVLDEMPPFEFQTEAEETAPEVPELASVRQIETPHDRQDLGDLEPSVEEYKRRLNELLRGKPLT